MSSSSSFRTTRKNLDQQRDWNSTADFLRLVDNPQTTPDFLRNMGGVGSTQATMKRRGEMESMRPPPGLEVGGGRYVGSFFFFFCWFELSFVFCLFYHRDTV